ncbi:MAG: hypothetical protein M9925_00765 [Chloroflexi bacterium]|nr:hypothetical protein [Chloroflexota bacterium]NJD64234.1 hypothetical protein [Chloroflexota bacterium]
MLRKSAVGIAVAGILAGVFAVSAACGGDDDGHGMGGAMSDMMSGRAPEGAIRVGLVNWAVEPERTSAPAGEVTFWAVHDMQHAHMSAEGGDIHDLQVMRKTADGSFELAGEVKGLRMGEAKALTLTLEPGEYELACTVVEVVGDEAIGHYAKGMRTPFTVTG